MVRWMRCPQDMGFETRALAVEYVTPWSQRFPAIFNHYEWTRKEHLISLKLEGQSGVRTRDLRRSKQAVLATAPGPRVLYLLRWIVLKLHINLSVRRPISHHLSAQCRTNVGITTQMLASNEPALGWLFMLIAIGLCEFKMTGGVLRTSPNDRRHNTISPLTVPVNTRLWSHDSLNHSAHGPTLDVKIWRLETSDSDD